MPTLHHYHSAEVRTKDAPLARNLFREIFMRNMFGIEYGQDW